MSDTDWNAELYDQKHSFVWKLASSVVEMLDPQSGERILDIGCGTGQLTSQIARHGADVVGIDNSQSMIREASRQYPQIEFVEADVHDFRSELPFDAIFSNAALHWTHDADAVCRCMAASLRSSGRVVLEFGGEGNVASLVGAIESAYHSITGQMRRHPWYFPSIARFASVLETHGIETIQAAMIDRPTPLEGVEGVRNWVKMFGGHWLEHLDARRHDAFFERIEGSARANLLKDGGWFADYRRIRVSARKVESAPMG